MLRSDDVQGIENLRLADAATRIAREYLRPAGVALAAGVGLLLTCPAAAIDWIGGDNDWNTSPFNWSPLDEPDPDDPVVFNTNNHVEMAMDNEILSLTMSNGIELDTETFLLDVNGNIVLSDAGTILRAGESDLVGLPDTSVSAENITINNGASYGNANFTSFIDNAGIGVFTIDTGGLLFGHGLIRSGDGIALGTPSVFVNDGVIRPGSVADGFVIGGNPVARTLTLAAIDGDARIDLDGNFGAGELDINRNQTLDIDVELSDDFDGTIDLVHNSTLDIQDAWVFAGTMNVDNGFVAGNPPFVPNIPADVAFLTGGAITMNESTTTINVLDTDGTLQFDAEFTADDGTIANNGLIVFNQDATINNSTDFQMLGINSSMTVGPGATVVINDDDMDFDGGGANTNVITVEAGGLLDMNLDSFEGNDRADGFITLNGGDLALTVTDGSWTMERRLTLINAGGSIPTLSGSAVEIGDDTISTQSNDADILVQGAGSSLISANVTFNSDTEVDVEAGATLSITGFSTFNSVNGAENALFDGPGDIFFDGGQVNEATTLNFSGGTVGLDGGGGPIIFLSATDFTIDAPMTINAAAIDPYGRSIAIPFPDNTELTINGNLGGILTVNLDNPNDSWTVTGSGIVNAEGGNVIFTTVLDGSDINLIGTLSADGFARTNARMTISGSISFIDASANFRLNGGSLADPNRIEGGTINSGGELSATNNTALHGFGTINSAIDFEGANSELLADDGTLTVNGTVLDVGLIGTADTDGVLELGGTLDTANAVALDLSGGSVIGVLIVNSGTTRGFGTVATSQINNNGTIAATDGELLIIDTVSNPNLDGVAENGIIQAVNGNLQIVDALNDAFNGTANVGASRSISFDGGWTLAASGTLNLNGGANSANAAVTDGAAQTLRGVVNVDQFARLDAATTFGAAVNVNLTDADDTLALDNDATVETGATFAGNGLLVNLTGNTLSAQDGTVIGVRVENRGTLAPGTSPGVLDVDGFEQTTDGTLDIEIANVAPGGFDVLLVQGNAELAGTLDVSLLGGFTPVLGNSFTIINTIFGNVSGTFDTLNLPALAGFAQLYVDYEPTLVRLRTTFPGDFDFDGDVDLQDFNILAANFSLTSGVTYEDGDADQDGDVDLQDFNILAANFGLPETVGELDLIGQLPEPGTLLVVLTLGASGLTRRK